MNKYYGEMKDGSVLPNWIKVDPKTGKSILSAGYFHYLHHKYLECNYGELTSPLDKWFGSFHDGTKKTHEKLFKSNRTA